MSVIIRSQFPIEPANNRWLYEGFGDPSLNGLTAAQGSIYTQLDSSPPGDIWTKTGPNDTDWAVQLTLPNTNTSLTTDQVAALAGTAGTPSATNRFVTDSDTRLGASGGSGGGQGLPSMVVATVPPSGTALTGDGSTDDAPALTTLANTTMGGSGTIYFTPGKTYRLATAITLPKGVTLWLPQGAVLKIDGVTVTIQSAITAGLWQIFSYVNSGKILFSTVNYDGGNKRVLACPVIYPEWWGAKADSTTDDTAALQAAIDATTGLPLTPATTRRNAGPAIELGSGVYRLSNGLYATDVTGLVIRGKGRYSTAISFLPNVVNTTFTCSSATANTISVATTPWTANAYSSGFWWAYVYSGTGANQWAQITANTNNTLTLGSNWTTTPDSTSHFVVAINAVLDLDGVLGPDIADLCVQTASTTYARYGIKYYRNSDRSAGGSTQGRFTNVRVTENYIDAGFRFGSKDLAHETNWQSDLCTLIGCQAIGRNINGDVAAYQVGFKFGDSIFDNVLNYTALGCDAFGHRYNVQVNATNVHWTGGTLQSAFGSEIYINGGVQGYSVFQGYRSESSAMMLDTSSPYGSVFPWNIAIRDVDMYLDAFTGNRLINFNLGDGNLTLENVRCVPVALRGTASGGTATTLTDSTQNWSTATVTYGDAVTAVGKTGWDVRIVAGTGNGQRRKVASNTATQLTVTPAWTVAPDNTSQYILMPRVPVAMNQGGHLTLKNCIFPATPLESAVMLGESADQFTAEITGYAETDDQAAITFGSSQRLGGTVHVQALKNTTPVGIGFLNLADGAQVDARIARTETGALATPNLTAAGLHVAALGTPTGQATKLGIANSGTTQYNYKIVLVDGKGNKSLPSATFSTAATCSATLDATGNAYIGIGPASGTFDPNCASVDVLKDDGTGTFKLLGNCPAWRFGQFYDVGQPLTAYTIPVADATGNATVDGTLTVTGTVNGAPISTSTILSSSQLSGLTGAADTTLHFHAADRARVNHTGTQSLSTITGGTATGSGYTLPDLTVTGQIVANGGISGQLASLTKTSDYTAATTDQVIYADATSANITITLPAAASMGEKELFVVKIDSSAHTVRVAAAGSDTIAGQASVTLASQYERIGLLSNGSARWDVEEGSGSGPIVFGSTVKTTGLLTAAGGMLVTSKPLVYNAVSGSTGTGGTATIDWSQTNVQAWTLQANTTFSFTAPFASYAELTLLLTQDATGSRLITWPASVKWPAATAPTLTTTAGKTDIVAFWYDGTTYWGRTLSVNS